MFKLTDSFTSTYSSKEPPFGPLGEITYLRTYSRLKENGDQEVWSDTVQRVVEGVYQIQEAHCKTLGLPWNAIKAQYSAQEMFDRMWNMKFLPPGRGLWAMGTAIVDKVGAAALMNCAFTSTKDIKTDFVTPFCFLMDMSMLGVGVGFDTLGAGTVQIREPQTNPEVYLVGDSREGWVDLARRILGAYVGTHQIPLVIDYSAIRPAGALLKTFGGVAAGADPLVELVVDLHSILKPLIGAKITSEAIVDLFNVIGRCIVSGNIRRSAELAIGMPEDDLFLHLKDSKNKAAVLHHRWASNNSVSVTKGQDYTELAELTAVNGEPGYIWLNNARKYGRMHEKDNRDAAVMGFNPCVEQPLFDKEMCCLVETFPANHEDLDDYKRTLKFAYLYGKSVTLIPTHNQHTNAIILKNRRIGTSQSGIIQSFQKIGRREHFRWSNEGYLYIRNLDTVYSDWLCVPRSIKVTTVKPSGTVSLLPGATPGVHYPHSEYYLRAIRFNDKSPLIEKLEGAGYRVEVDKYSPNTKVAFFPVHEKHFDRSKSQVSMFEQLENAAQMQRYWSDNGVSATITFSKAEAGQIKYALELYETRLKAISFLPMEDHGYEQAPYAEITKIEYNEYMKSIKKVKWSGDTHELDEKFCDSEACLIG